MGAVAKGVLDAGGEVVGVIPEALFDSEVANHDCTELLTDSGMHERKQKFTDLSNGFVTIPGVVGSAKATAGIVLEDLAAKTTA